MKFLNLTRMDNCVYAHAAAMFSALWILYLLLIAVIVAYFTYALFLDREVTKYEFSVLGL